MDAGWLAAAGPVAALIGGRPGHRRPRRPCRATASAYPAGVGDARRPRLRPRARHGPVGRTRLRPRRNRLPGRSSAHYYGGSSLAGLSPAQEATQVRVALTENDGNTVIVTSGSAFTVSGLSVPGGQAVLMSPAGGGTVERLSWVRGVPGRGPPPAAIRVSDPTASPASNPGLGDPATASQGAPTVPGRRQPDGQGLPRGVVQLRRRAPDGQHRPARAVRLRCGAQRVPGRLGDARVARVRRASPGDSRSSRPRRWPPART